MPLQILIPAGAAIIVIIVLIRIYPLLHIFISKLIFGKLSSRYIATYKSYAGQSPYPYCIKDDFINHIAGFYKETNNRKEFETNKDILFQDIPFGTKTKGILKSNRKPFCINANRLELFDLKVFGYRDQMFTSDLKKYFFFVNGEFALGQLTFKSPLPENMKEIVGVIGKKYLNNSKMDSNNFIIRGKNSEVLLCEYNGFHLSISYLSRAFPHINEMLDNYWDASTNLSFGKQSSFEAELMEKL